jgi:glycolate oxidase FAD binding subunit
METRAFSGTSVVDIEAAWSDLRSLVGTEHLRKAAREDTVSGILPQMVVEPGAPGEVANVLKTAAQAGLHVLPRGGGTKMEWGNPPRNSDLIVSLRRLDRVVEHAWGDMTATVEAGCTVQRLQETLAEHGQRLALDPLWPEKATIGGILAANDSGPLRIRFGSLRDLIIGITLVLPDGTIAKSGGKVVKNVAGYDLPKLATGSLGTLGVIAQAIFRLHPVPQETRFLSFSANASREMNKFVLAVLDSKLVPTGVQVRAESSSPIAVDLRFEGTAAGCEAQSVQVVAMASAARQLEPSVEVWNARAGLWSGAEPSAVLKFTLLPGDLGGFLDRIKEVSERLRLSWRLVAQAVGAGLLRLEADVPALATATGELRGGLESRGGSLVILSGPRDLRAKTDAWGSAGDALALMRGIKAQFDPADVLNPGRFVGGI